MGSEAAIGFELFQASSDRPRIAVLFVFNLGAVIEPIGEIFASKEIASVGLILPPTRLNL
jgi:hypothetical protein